MTNPWGNLNTNAETMNFAEIMSEEYAQRLQTQEFKKVQSATNKTQKETMNKTLFGDSIKNDVCDKVTYSEVAACSKMPASPIKLDEDGWEDCSELLLVDKKIEEKIPAAVLEALQAVDGDCNSDAVIAQMLQSQFDHEYNEELRRLQQKRNKHAKVTVALDKFHRNGDLEFLNDDNDDDNNDINDVAGDERTDWDRFDTNEKIFDGIPKCGFKMDHEGEMITKHDPKICGVRNACRVMSFPPEFQTGDAGGFDMHLSNEVFNQLKTYSRRHGVKKHKMQDRKVTAATAEMGVDEPTRLLLYKLINNQLLEQINGIVSTGKEAVILHADTDPNFTGIGDKPVATIPSQMPKECAVKIFKTTLNQFKQRDRYIKDDFRFKDRFKKQNNRVIINMWAEKEMHNLMRMRNVGINCPEVIVLKKHVLIMSFIGEQQRAAPKLKDALLNDAELNVAYEEIVNVMYILYNKAKLVHADLSEYNILWWNDKCWFIDVAQSVEPGHPSALEFLMRDCDNIVTFFNKRGLPNIYTREQLFEFITSLNAETHNAAMLERIHTRGASIKEATLPDAHQDECPDELKPIKYPFELAWEKSLEDREYRQQQLKDTEILIKTTTNDLDLSVNALGESIEVKEVAKQKLKNKNLTKMSKKSLTVTAANVN